MGTSSIFNGRNDKNSLLPEDYEPNQQDSITEPIKWKTVKSDLSKYINSGGTYGSIKHIARQYVRAAGGSHKMASQSFSGVKTGTNIGNFFNGILSNGFETTFKNLGIEYEGKSVSEVFSRLVDSVAPNSNTKEDVVAKEAAQAALSKLYDYIELNELDLNCIDSMPQELMNEALKEYTGSYIWITMMKDLGSRLEMYISNAEDSYNLECEFKEMIMGIVDVEFANKGNIINNDVSESITYLYERCLGVLEGIV